MQWEWVNEVPLHSTLGLPARYGLLLLTLMRIIVEIYALAISHLPSELHQDRSCSEETPVERIQSRPYCR
jgi:hypothetical protein